MADVKNVLFLCTGNSARSIMAEAIINDISINKGQFRGFSAGSRPTGTVNPLAVEQLQNLHLSTTGLRSKSWEEFTGANAPVLDFVFTVCDNAAGETCPVWPGQPMTAHGAFPTRRQLRVAISRSTVPSSKPFASYATASSC